MLAAVVGILCTAFNQIDLTGAVVIFKHNELSKFLKNKKNYSKRFSINLFCYGEFFFFF